MPAREELAARVRRFRIEGYELDDLIQEAYLCLLDPESDGNIERHLKKLSMRHYRRVIKVERRVRAQQRDLYEDNARARSDGDIDSLVLLIACESECDNDADRWLLNSLATGYSYRDFEQAWNCRKMTAWKRVSRFRVKMRARILLETERDFVDGDRGGPRNDDPAPGDLCRYDLSGAAVE